MTLDLRDGPLPTFLRQTRAAMARGEARVVLRALASVRIRARNLSAGLAVPACPKAERRRLAGAIALVEEGRQEIEAWLAKRGRSKPRRGGSRRGRRVV